MAGEVFNQPQSARRLRCRARHADCRAGIPRAGRRAPRRSARACTGGGACARRNGLCHAGTLCAFRAHAALCRGADTRRRVPRCGRHARPEPAGVGQRAGLAAPSGHQRAERAVGSRSTRAQPRFFVAHGTRPPVCQTENCRQFGRQNRAGRRPQQMDNGRSRPRRCADTARKAAPS